MSANAMRYDTSQRSDWQALLAQAEDIVTSYYTLVTLQARTVR